MPRLLPLAAALALLAARAPGQWVADPAFRAWPGLDSQVTRLAELSDGRIAVAGGFSSGGEPRRSKLAVLRADGSLDPGFDPGRSLENTADSCYASCLAALPDGRLLVAGYFDRVQGHVANAIACFRPDGALDTAGFAGAGDGARWSRYAGVTLGIAVQPDGRATVTGQFRYYGGQSHGGIVRLRPDGSHDPTFRAGTGFEVRQNEASPGVCVLLPDGRLLVVGSQRRYQGRAVGFIVRLLPDGALDTSFHPPEFNGSPMGLSVLPGGRLAVYGGFTLADGAEANGLVILRMDGSRDFSFRLGTLWLSALRQYPGAVWGCLALSDGNLLVAGHFCEVAGRPRPGIARLRPDGRVAPDFRDGGFNPPDVNSIQWDREGRILCTGVFREYRGVPAPGVARLIAAPGEENAEK